MRISLVNGSTIYPLAGQAGVAESVHASASDFRIEGDIAKQTSLRVRADNAQTWDRRNLQTAIQFGTVRTFETCLLAEKFAADYDETYPRSGVLVIEGTGGTGYPDSILIAGDLTTDGFTPIPNPPAIDWYATTTIGGQPYQIYGDGTGDYCVVFDDGGGGFLHWLMEVGGSVWTSTEDVTSPDLVTTWTPTAPATGTPTVIGNHPDHRYLLDAVLDPPARQVIGCSVLLRYTATGGRLASGLPGTWSSDIPWPVGGNWEDS
jgi:hypothetical protein